MKKMFKVSAMPIVVLIFTFAIGPSLQSANAALSGGTSKPACSNGVVIDSPSPGQVFTVKSDPNFKIPMSGHTSSAHCGQLGAVLLWSLDGVYKGSTKPGVTLNLPYPVTCATSYSLHTVRLSANSSDGSQSAQQVSIYIGTNDSSPC